MSIYRAYWTATGSLKSYVLTHDVKKALATQTGKSGLVHVVSMGATTAVGLFENDPEILGPLQQSIFALFQSHIKPATSRRSGLSGPAYHLMAGFMRLAVTVPFENGKLLTSPFQDVMALDFEPKPGRREFVITIVNTSPEGKQ